MKATELIADLAKAISWVGDHELVVEMHDCDGHTVFNRREAEIVYLTDTTYEDKPFRVVGRVRVAAPESVEEGR